jgi:hypothetical protein
MNLANLPIVDLPWWVGLGLAVVGLLMLAGTTVFTLPVIPRRFLPHAFWLGLMTLFMGITATVVFT